MKIKNIAIIAHVDHGKTTLVDKLLEMSNTFRENEEITERAMDSNAIEKERGITILAKTAAITYKDYRINILDTPGHADFGGEVERIMNMVDGVLLVVDSYEGTMPQTRFVLKKALEAKVKPIVVVNKVDRLESRITSVVDEVIDLFIELGADYDDLDFPVVYASAILGTSSKSAVLSDQEKTMEPILDTIIEHVPDPKEIVGKFLFQPALLDYNDYVGRIGIGVVKRGAVKVGEMVSCMRLDGTMIKFRIQKLYSFFGLKRIEIDEAKAGDIIAIAGLADISVGETICSVGFEEALEPLRIDEPTLQMTFSTNSSPVSGKEGSNVTAKKIAERLFKETERDVSLRVFENSSESWIVSGRGELHLAILIENMRREDYELEVSKPAVIIKEEGGVSKEPYERVQLDVPEETVGSVIEKMGIRGAILDSMDNANGQVRLNYVIASRGLLGFMTDFLTITRGYGIMNHSFLEFRENKNPTVCERKQGVLVSMENGKATAYGIGALEDRGVMFVKPGDNVYEGMIVGECNREDDLAINVVRGKQLTNVRASGSDKTVVLKKPRLISLEYALEYINNDELVEITPLGIRLRKKILNTNLRKKQDKDDN